MSEAKRRKLNPAEEAVDVDADASGDEDDAFESEEAAGIARGRTLVTLVRRTVESQRW